MRHPRMDDWWCRTATNGHELGLDGNRIALGGRASGGGLAASVCLQGRDAGSFRPALRDDGEGYVERLRRAGVPVEHDRSPGVDHYFLTENPTRARTTMAMIAAAILRATRP